MAAHTFTMTLQVVKLRNECCVISSLGNDLFFISVFGPSRLNAELRKYFGNEIMK